MNNTDKLINFLGSLLVLGVAIGIFMMLMSTVMPDENRELLIAFVSVLFGAMSGSLKKITGDESILIDELTRKNKELEEKLNKLQQQQTDEQ